MICLGVDGRSLLPLGRGLGGNSGRSSPSTLQGELFISCQGFSTKVNACVAEREPLNSPISDHYYR